MNRESLLKACDFARRAITGKAAPPILECLHLKGDGQRLQVTGNNLDLWARMEVESPLVIDVCAPAKRLTAVLGAWDDDEITIEINGPVITLFGGNGRKAPVKTLPGEDFPPVGECAGKRFPIPGDAIARVLSAVSTDEGRYTLNGVFLEKGHAVSTDGRRMMAVEIDGPETSLILPTASVKILSGESGEMMSDGRKFTATGDGWSIGGKVIEGNYPNWRQVMPKYGKGVAVPDGFADVIERAMRCIEDESTVRSVSIERGRITVGVAPDFDFSEDFATGLDSFRVNPQYLLEAIKAAGDGAAIHRGDTPGEGNPVIITSPGFQSVLMPIR
jgi:DNA polymerase III sliding clamp (beta) subunit (PCNA family)